MESLTLPKSILKKHIDFDLDSANAYIDMISKKSTSASAPDFTDHSPPKYVKFEGLETIEEDDRYFIEQGKTIYDYDTNNFRVETKYLSAKVREVYDSLEPFTYNDKELKLKLEKGVKRQMRENTILADGSRYFGQLRKDANVLDGMGYVIYKNKELFEGIFDYGDTVYGRYISKKGDVYEGEMKFNRFHGFGELKMHNGTVFRGRFKFGKKCGLGTLSTLNKGEYIGQFSKDKKNGFGKISYPDGKTWEGTWVNDKQNGFGFYTYADGAVEQTQYKNGVLLQN